MDVPLFVALTCDDWIKNDATVSLVTSRTVVVVDGDIVGVRKGTFEKLFEDVTDSLSADCKFDDVNRAEVTDSKELLCEIPSD